MTIKLMLFKSGEDIIADVSEMCVGEDDERRVIGYRLEKPCIVKMRNPTDVEEDANGTIRKSGFEVSLFPWMPLSAESNIPDPSDWLITMVEPVTKLKGMYIEDVLNYGQDNQTDSTGEQRETDQ